MINFVYILKSLKNGSYYIGSTSDLKRRLVEHNAGKTKSLKHLTPFELKFSQEFKSKAEAYRVEKKLKKWKNKQIIERIIEDGVIKSV